MAFNIKEGCGRTYWALADGSSTYYIGQLLAFNNSASAELDGTVAPLATSSGAGDTTQKQVIAGICVGFSKRYPTSVTVGSHSLQYDTGVVSQANQLAREWTGVEGMYSKADPAVMIEVAEILPHTVIEGNICQGALGTAPTVVTTTAVGGTDGMVTADTGNTPGYTHVTKTGTIYCRTGANAGITRVNKNTTATAPSVTTAFPYDTAVGDTFLVLPFKQGQSNISIAGPGLYVDSSAAPVIAGTDRFHVIVYKLNLADAGRETIEFRFGGDHFCRFRA